MELNAASGAVMDRLEKNPKFGAVEAVPTPLPKNKHDIIMPPVRGDYGQSYQRLRSCRRTFIIQICLKFALGRQRVQSVSKIYAQ